MDRDVWPKIKAVAEYSAWHCKIYGYSPLELVQCSECKEDIHPGTEEVYRCYMCGIACHRECLKRHCENSRNLGSTEYPLPTKRTFADLMHWIGHLHPEERQFVKELLEGET